MPVIINETEIVVEPPPAPAPSAPQPSPTGARLTPEEVIRVVQRQQERLARVWAD
ncbi:MAG TPA: hypothetical protein PKL67_03945 [Anaerolineae bacterium]|nr:hypothetical protein [Anaerolineae bacterium]